MLPPGTAVPTSQPIDIILKFSEREEGLFVCCVDFGKKERKRDIVAEGTPEVPLVVPYDIIVKFVYEMDIMGIGLNFICLCS